MKRDRHDGWLVLSHECDMHVIKCANCLRKVTCEVYVSTVPTGLLFDAVDQHAVSRIIFWISADASRKTIPCGVPTTAISDSSSIPSKNPHTPLPLSLDLSLGLFQVKYLFRRKHIPTWHSCPTVGSAITLHSISSTVRPANCLSCIC